MYIKKLAQNNQSCSLSKLKPEYSNNATYIHIAGRQPTFGAYVKTGSDNSSIVGYTKDGVLMNSSAFGNPSAPSMEYAIGNLFGGGQQSILVSFKTIFSTNVIYTFNSNGGSSTRLVIDASGNLGVRDDSGSTTQYVTGLIQDSTHSVMLTWDEFGTSTIHFDGKEVGTLVGIPAGKNEITTSNVYMVVSWRNRSFSKQQANLLSENPWRIFTKQNIVYPVSVAGSSGIPILTLASYTSLTQTTVKPRVTITF